MTSACFTAWSLSIALLCASRFRFSPAFPPNFSSRVSRYCCEPQYQPRLRVLCRLCPSNSATPGRSLSLPLNQLIKTLHKSLPTSCHIPLAEKGKPFGNRNPTGALRRRLRVSLRHTTPGKIQDAFAGNDDQAIPRNGLILLLKVGAADRSETESQGLRSR